MSNLDLNQQSVYQYFLALDHIDAKDVNAISGSLIYGTPALTATAGFVHNINRQIQALPESEVGVAVDLKEIQLEDFMIIAHQCEPKIYREHSGQDYTFLLKKAPLTRSGANPPIIEEGRLDYLSSLVIRFKTSELLSKEQQEALGKAIKKLIPTLRLAGGTIASIRGAWVFNNNELASREILQKIGFGYVLLSQEKLLEELVTEGDGSAVLNESKTQKDGLDYLLDTARIYYHPPKDDNSRWTIQTLQQGRGWLVPLMVGYQAISDVISSGELKEVRNPKYESQFVEPIYSLGKWVLTYRLLNDPNQKFEQLFWNTATSDALYLVQQEFED